MSCRRATSPMRAPGSSASASILSFASSDQRRLRSVPDMISMRAIKPLCSGINVSTNAGSNARTSPDLPDQQKQLTGRSLWIEIELAIKPGPSPLQDIRPVLLQCMCGLSLKVHPQPRGQAPSALRLILTCRSTDRRSTISSSVTSLRSSISSTTNASCASSADGRLQPCGREVGSPSFALAIQRIAVEIPTPNRVAACRRRFQYAYSKIIAQCSCHHPPLRRGC